MSVGISPLGSPPRAAREGVQDAPCHEAFSTNKITLENVLGSKRPEKRQQACIYSRILGEVAVDLLEQDGVVHGISSLGPPSVIGDAEEHFPGLLVGEYLRRA